MLPSRTVRLSLRLSDIALCPDGQWRACCPECGEVIDLFQPEAEDPAHLLGVCESCRAWYLLGWRPGTSGGFMLKLPDFDKLKPPAEV